MIFHKSVSAGNDFLHVDLEEYDRLVRAVPGLDHGSLTERMCRRHDGAGADGVVFYRCGGDYTEFRIFNRDGNEAELSGNGMAGLSALLCHLGKTGDTGTVGADMVGADMVDAETTGGTTITLKTKKGIRQHQLLERTSPAKGEQGGTAFRLRIEIGVPDFSDQAFFPFLDSGGAAAPYETGGQYHHEGIAFYPVSVGNPHVVVLVDNIHHTDQLIGQGKLLERAAIFPQNTNVEFVTPVENGICRVFYYERGVGQTLSSSTGSAAVFAVLQKLGRIDTDLTIQTTLGEIKIHGKKRVYIDNSTKIVYKCIWLV